MRKCPSKQSGTSIWSSPKVVAAKGYESCRREKFLYGILQEPFKAGGIQQDMKRSHRTELEPSTSIEIKEYFPMNKKVNNWFVKHRYFPRLRKLTAGL